MYRYKHRYGTLPNLYPGSVLISWHYGLNEGGLAMAFQPSRAQKRLADAMSERRADLGLSHRDVAAQTGWSTAKISRFENTQSKLEPDDVRRLAKIYTMSDA